MAMQLGSSRTQQFPTFGNFASRQHFLAIRDYCHQIRQYSLPFKLPEARTFDGGHVRSSQPNIPKTYAPHYNLQIHDI